VGIERGNVDQKVYGTDPIRDRVLVPNASTLSPQGTISGPALNVPLAINVAGK
jgi:hypothetical protein